jgi:hypothetical protein
MSMYCGLHEKGRRLIADGLSLGVIRTSPSREKTYLCTHSTDSAMTRFGHRCRRAQSVPWRIKNPLMFSQIASALIGVASGRGSELSARIMRAPFT